MSIKIKLEQFSQNKVKKNLRTYGFAAAVVICALILNIFAVIFSHQVVPFLFAVLAVLLVSWYGGVRPGLVATGILFFANLYILRIFPVSAQISSQTQFLLSVNFLINGICASFFVDRSRNPIELKELRASEEEYIQELHQTKTAHRQALKEILARDEFLSIASHELKTPLTSVLIQLQSILKNIRSVSLAEFSVEKLMKMLVSAEEQTKRLSKMINDLLNVSLITTGKLDLEMEKGSLTEAVQDVVNGFSDKAMREGSVIHFRPGQAIFAQFDKIRIEQAVTNLISNAIKYGSGKPITLTLRKTRSDAILIVKDEGIGISKDIQEKIFARFERGVSARDYQGLGVGLYITSQIIRMHKGQIKIKSQEGHGSEFIITIPL